MTSLLELPSPSEGHAYRHRTRHGPGHRGTDGRDRTRRPTESRQSIEASTVNGNSISARFDTGEYDPRTKNTTL